MPLFFKFYVLFNQVECLLWWSFGLYFVYLIFFRKDRDHLLTPESLLVVGFMLFGLSDYFEAHGRDGVPGWLWAWKIANGSVLFGLLIWRDFLMRGMKAFSPWRFIAVGVILAVAVYAIVRR